MEEITESLKKSNLEAALLRLYRRGEFLLNLSVADPRIPPSWIHFLPGAFAPFPLFSPRVFPARIHDIKSIYTILYTFPD